jgi:predicted transcriptional regulator
MNRRRFSILSVLCSQPSLRSEINAELVRAGAISRRSSDRQLARMERLGLVVHQGGLYELTELGAKALKRERDRLVFRRVFRARVADVLRGGPLWRWLLRRLRWP